MVNQSTATIVTSALTPVTIGNPIRDTATVTGGPAPAPAPTGTVTFTLFGPGNPTCTGVPIFTSANRPLGGAPPPTATSEDFVPTAVGTYQWVAVYSGDANYASVTSPCGAPNEASVVNQSTATIVTSALTPVTIGSPIRDTATVTGGAAPAPAPTGTVTFTLFGPANPTCTGAPIFTSGPIALAGGPPPTATSADFVPTDVGTYNWVAVYSGDASYPSVTSPCGAPNEASVVNQSTATIVTSAFGPVTLGNAIRDTATVTGGPAPAPAPTGTVTFTLFGPANPTCTGAPIFTSGPIALAGGPPPTATSADFVPPAAGTYNWVAVYSGDANYASVTSPCGAPNEASVVTPAPVAIATSASTPVPIGSPINDTATVTGAPAPAPAPTGSVTFTLFGPGNPTCTGAPIFTSSARPLGGGPPPTATSGDFVPPAVGTYQWVAVYSGDANYPSVTSPCGAPNEASVVAQSTATIVTSALTPVTIGSPIRDTATVTGGAAPAPPPTGTVTFTLFGPANPTCTGAPIFTSGPIALAGGPPPTATSADFVPTAVGTYQWVAVYSGDANYASVTSPCGAPNEASVVNQSTATIVTSALTPVTLGAPIRDTATVTGGPAPAPAPTGTVSFTLFGPGDATCVGTPVFSSNNRPLGGAPPPTATSADFTPTAAGTYTWVAVYSGDANYASVTSPCGAPNEASVVAPATPSIVTSALTPVTIGSPISDTATVTGGAGPGSPVPTGTVVFTLFGPANPTCTGAPIFTSAAVPLAGGPPPTASSGDFTPTAIGTYNWVAVYSGDANYTSVTSPCGAPNEASVVNQATVAIVTAATGPVTIGSPISDVATVTGSPAPAPTPTGSVTFTLFGPGNPTCTGAPIFTSSARPLGGGPPPTALSEEFTPAAPGTYQWVAVYNGDANHPVATSPCGAPGEASIVNQSTSAIVTSATTPVTIGNPIRDVATVTGGPAPAPTPTGTVTFTLFGPANPTCTGAPIFTSGPIALAGGPPPTATSGDFTPTAVGTYNWVAVYSGDANHPPATSPCGAPDEASAILPADVTIVTSATPRATLGQPISDTATVTGSPAPAPTPTGTVTFTLFGPDDATCAGPAIFTSAARPLGGGPPPTATSEPFTPTAVGSYNWVAAYSGDASYNALTSACGAAGETSLVAPVPIIQVDKTVTPPSRTVPGGDFTFTVVVTNTSDEVLTITSLTDDIYGDITTRANSTCTNAIGTVLQPSPGPFNTYSCTFVGPFFGDPGDTQTDVVTVRATNPTGVEVTDSDDAIVTITPLPVIQVDKAVTPPSRTVPGGDFTFTVVVTNNSNEVLTITSLTDDVYGDLATQGTCTSAVGTVLQPGGTYSCTFVGPFFGDPGDTQTDVVTVRATNPSGVEVTDSDDAIVTITPLPVIQVDKTVTPPSRTVPGGDFLFNIVVTNNSTEVLTITSLTDDVYGNLATRGTCTSAIGTVLQPGGTYSCSFVGPFFGDPGDTQTDVVTVRATNPSGVEVTDTDDAIVTITPLPVIQVVKTATPLSRPVPGGDFTFDVVVTNTSNEVLTITSLTDNIYGDITTRANSTCTDAVGTVLQPGESYSCSFVGAFNGAAGASQTDVVSVRATNPEGREVSDSDDAIVTITPLPVIRVDKTATPLSLPEPGGDFTFNIVVTNTSNEVLTITALTDDVYGNLATRGTCTTAVGTVLQPGGTYACSFVGPFFGDPGDSQTDTVTVRATNPAGVEVTDSDDAVVFITDVVPAIHVDKTASPLSRPEPGGTFTFTVVVTNIGPEALTITSLTDDIYGNLATQGTCTNAIGTVLQPGGTYTCTFPGDFRGNAGQSQTDTVTVRGQDNEGTQVTDSDDAIVTLTNVPPSIVVVKDARPTSMVAPGGTFTFDVAVTNTSFEPVTITSLTDNVYGNLNGKGSCAIGTRLAPGATYRCSFPGDFRGAAGASQTDVVTARAVDDDNTEVTAKDDAVVSLTPVPVVNIPVVVKQVPPPARVARTGSDPGGPALLAIVLLLAGTMMVAAAGWYRRPRLAGPAGDAGRDTAWFGRPPTPTRGNSVLGTAGLGGDPPEDPPGSS